MNLREANKARRVDAIVAATKDLMRAELTQNISTERIAEKALVSPATIYNLVGKKRDLFLAVVNDHFARLEAKIPELPSDDPLIHGEQFVLMTARHVCADAEVCRVIFKEGFSFLKVDGEDQIRPRPTDLVDQILVTDAFAKRLIAESYVADVSMQVLMGYQGCLLSWVNRQLTDVEFEQAAVRIYWSAIASFGKPGPRKTALDFLVTSEQ